MHIYAYIYIYTYIYIYILIPVHGSVCLCVAVCQHLSICLSMYWFSYLCVYTQNYIHVCACIHLFSLFISLPGSYTIYLYTMCLYVPHICPCPSWITGHRDASTFWTCPTAQEAALKRIRMGKNAATCQMFQWFKWFFVNLCDIWPSLKWFSLS